jgi:phosphoribosylformylglycinamidine (FGAM) synthase PurS component
MHDEREELLALVNKSINEIKVMDAFDGDAELRDGALSLLNFYKSGLEGDYHKMIELIANRERSKEDHAKLEAYKDGLIANEKIHDDKFEDLQIAFAKKHKLDLL